MRGTPDQTDYFYTALRRLVLFHRLPANHLLHQVPLDPDLVGIGKQKEAVEQLHKEAGNWYYALRRLWYSYHEAGKRTSAIHRCLSIMTIHDSDLRHLLRSHDGDQELFPYIHIPNPVVEWKFWQKIKELDARKGKSA